TSAAVTIMTIFMMLIPLCWPPGRADRVTPLFRFVCARRPLLTIPRSGAIAGGMAPDYLSPRPSNGSNVIGRIWTVVIGWDAGRHEPTKAGLLSIRMTARAAETPASGQLRSITCFLSCARLMPRLEWLKGKKWGNPAGGDQILEARNRTGSPAAKLMFRRREARKAMR